MYCNVLKNNWDYGFYWITKMVRMLQGTEYTMYPARETLQRFVMVGHYASLRLDIRNTGRTLNPPQLLFLG